MKNSAIVKMMFAAKPKKLFLIALVLIANVANAFAESGEGHHSGHSGIESLIPYWVNFLLLFAVLFFVLRGKVLSFWAERQKNISSQIFESVAELRKSQSALETARAKLAAVGSERARVNSEITKQAEFDAQAAVAVAREKVARLAKQAEEFGQAEMRRAEQDVRREFVNASIVQAKTKLTADTSLQFGQGVQDTLVGCSKQLVIH